uniref:Putative hat-25 zm n=1 Tax=Ixodes ricinus TaxID=34613 RepID=A0A147BPQ7_IXORI
MRRGKALPQKVETTPSGNDVTHYVLLPADAVVQQPEQASTSGTPSEGGAYVITYPYSTSTSTSASTEWLPAMADAEEPSDNASSQEKKKAKQPKQPKHAKKKRTSSVVWQHFEHHAWDKLTVVCNHCRMNVRLGKEGGSGRIGTTAMHKHVRIHHPHLSADNPAGAAAVPASEAESAVWHLQADGTSEEYSDTSTVSQHRGRKRAYSSVWEHFEYHESNKLLVVCKHCKVNVRLGKEGGCNRPGTTAMHKHVLVHHHLLLQKKSASKPGLEAAGKGAQGSTRAKWSSKPTFKIQASTGRSKSGESTEPHQQWDLTHHSAMVLNQRLAEYIAKSMKPFHAVEEPAFVELMQVCVPQWKIPRRDYFASAAVPTLAASIKHSLKECLKPCVGGAVHLTVDIWSSRQAKDYMSVCAHWMIHEDSDGQLSRHKAVLNMSGFNQTHTDGSVAHKLGTVIADWFPSLGLTARYVVAENALTIQQALSHVQLKHIPCAAHSMGLVVKGFLARFGGDLEATLETARSVCSHFSNFEGAWAKLNEAQRRNDRPVRRLFEDDPSCWESTFSMVERLCDQQVAVTECMEGSCDGCLTPERWELLRQVKAVLRPFKEVTSLLTMDSATLGQVLPLLRFAEKILQTTIERAQEGTASALLSRHLLGELRASRHLRAVRADVTFWAASFLDPRFRDTFGTYVGGAEGPVENKLEDVKQHLLGQILEAYLQDKRSGDVKSLETPALEAPSGSGASQPAAVGGEFSLWLSNAEEMGLTVPRAQQSPDQMRIEAAAVARSQLEAYVQDSVIDFSAPMSDPARYWERKRNHWPSLYAVAVAYLACPPTSVHSEKVFKKYGPIAAEGRNGLSPEDVSAFCFIRTNAAWIPKDPLAAPRDILDTLFKAAEETGSEEREVLEGNEDVPLLHRVVFEDTECC